MKNKVRNFQHYFEIEFLSSPLKKWKTVFLRIYFLIYDYKSCLTVFVNPWKNQKYLFIINLFTSLLQMKLFLRNNIVATKKCTVEELISCTMFFLRLCGWVQKQPFGGASESTCYYMMRKSFKNSSTEVHFLVRVQLTDLQCWYKWTCSRAFFNNFDYFRKLFTVTLRLSKQPFSEYPRMAASMYYF